MEESKTKAADVLAYLKDNLSPMIAEKVAEAVESARKDAGTPAAVKAAADLRQAEQDRDRNVKGLGAAGRYARALAVGNMQVQKAADFVRANWKDEAFSKALAESVFIDGGVLVPTNVSNEIIELLRPASVVRALGAREVPMPNGNLTMPYVSTGVTPFSVAENMNVMPSGMTFGELSMRARKIRAIVPISNDLLRDASPAADAFVQQDMVLALRQLEDQYFIRGTGTANQPRGLRNLVAPANVITASNAAATVGGSTVDEKIRDMMLAIQTVETALNGAPIVRGGWIFNTRVKYNLMTAKDVGGAWLFQDEMMTRGTLWGFPFRATPVMPANLNDVGALQSKESEIIFADFDKILIGNAGGLVIDSERYGTYHDGTTVISGLSTDQTVIAGTLRSDIGARYQGSEIAVIRGTTWGA